MKSDLRRSLTIAAVEALQDAGSWTGRIHVHKLLFLVDALKLAEVPFTFELYQYGPYSFDLDYTIGDLETYGELERYYRKPGYGPSYRTTDSVAESVDELPEEVLNVLERTAARIGQLDSTNLELVATCVWVFEVEHEDDDDAVVRRVANIKPKYTPAQIRQQLETARKLSEDLN